jgi:hypothetical protein
MARSRLWWKCRVADGPALDGQIFGVRCESEVARLDDSESSAAMTCVPFLSGVETALDVLDQTSMRRERAKPVKKVGFRRRVGGIIVRRELSKRSGPSDSQKWQRLQSAGVDNAKRFRSKFRVLHRCICTSCLLI